MTTTTFGRRGVTAPHVSPAPAVHTPVSSYHAPSDIDWGRRLFSFQGRVTRRYYWLSRLGLFLAAQFAIYTSKQIKIWVHPGASKSTVFMALGADLLVLGLLGCAYWICLSVVVRRWHDRDKSGFWTLLGLIPLVGWLWQAIECGRLEGTLGPNRFGPSPKGFGTTIYQEFS